MSQLIEKIYKKYRGCHCCFGSPSVAVRNHQKLFEDTNFVVPENNNLVDIN